MKVVVKLEIPAVKIPEEPADFLRKRTVQACGVASADLLNHRILKRSLDARKKPDVKVIYSVLAELKDGTVPVNAVEPAPPETELWHLPEIKRPVQNPVIVGAGPAGLFAGLVLAAAGCDPIIVERGKDVSRRKEDIDQFFADRQVNPESNFLFGEGGAGTWSDGKLFTRIRDPRCDFVLREFVEAGAIPEILYYAHPHLGSDKLPEIIANIRKKIIALGGTFLWDTRVESVNPGIKFEYLTLANGEKLHAPAAIIGCGHSARKLITSLTKYGVHYRMKGFQLGCRIEHPAGFINRSQFGTETPCAALGAAEYSLSSRPFGAGNGAATFCMCPGGEIIPAVCEAGKLCTNGMSNAARDGNFSNAAIVTTLQEGLFRTPAEAFDFLEEIETAAYQAGGDGFAAPAQRAMDFIYGQKGSLPRATSYRCGIVPRRLDVLLPDPVRFSLSGALRHFNKICKGFAKEGTLIGIETRVSSPVRFERDPETLMSSMQNLFIGGEGGGCAGGIVSAAVDGIKLAEALLRTAR